MRSAYKRIIMLGITLAALCLDASTAVAQTVIVPYTASWKYLIRTSDGGTAWRGTTFNDSTWPTGSGIFTYPSGDPVPPGQTRGTTLPFTGNCQYNGVYIRTVYFRHYFNLTVPTNGIFLVFSNAVDDGAVYYLNGVEIGNRYNMPTGTITWDTLAPAAATEGAESGFTYFPNNLRQGTNVIAVEVHNNGTSSSDMVFGMKVAYYTGQAPTITAGNGPKPINCEAGTVTNFTVVANGTAPLYYQWRRNGTPIAGATAATYTFTATEALEGSYTVLVSNIFGTTISAAATLQVFGNPPVITNQPPDDSLVDVLESFALTIGVSGSVPAYQWQRQSTTPGVFTTIPGAIAASYAVPSTIAGTNFYRCIVTNSYGRATSIVARVIVAVDGTGPTLASAIADEAGPPWIIRVNFSDSKKQILPLTLTNIANYTITEVGTTNRLTVTNITSGGALTALLRVGNRWQDGANYVLNVNNVRDWSPATNVIAPNSKIGLTFNTTTEVFGMNNTWRYYNGDGLWTPYDLESVLPGWKTNYLEGAPQYSEGQGVLGFDYDTLVLCTGSVNTVLSIQPYVAYFTTRFFIENVNPRAQFYVTGIIDDGAVFYLNGKEIYRSANLPTGPIIWNTETTSAVGNAACVDFNFGVTNLVSGINYLSVEVHQSDMYSTDIVFGCDLTARLTTEYVVPPTNRPSLKMTRAGNNMTFSWVPGGYALEHCSDVDGFWREVQPIMTNPLTTSITNATRKFWRLIKKQ